MCSEGINYQHQIERKALLNLIFSSNRRKSTRAGSFEDRPKIDNSML